MKTHVPQTLKWMKTSFKLQGKVSMWKKILVMLTFKKAIIWAFGHPTNSFLAFWLEDDFALFKEILKKSLIVREKLLCEIKVDDIEKSLKKTVKLCKNKNLNFLVRSFANSVWNLKGSKVWFWV